MSLSATRRDRCGMAGQNRKRLHVREIIYQLIGCVIGSILAFHLTGCASSSPRSTSEKQAQTKQPIPPEYAEQIEEERSENDIHADINERFSSISAMPGEDNPALDRHRILNQIMAVMGTPYSYNRTDSTGIDCSGFTALIYRGAVGKDLPRSSQQQFTLGQAVERNKLRFGDLVFFATEGTSPSHVGIYVGDGLFAHASVSMGVTISVLESSYYKRRYLGARRIVQ